MSTLGRRREHLRHRLFAIFHNGAIQSVSPATDAFKSGKAPQIIMVFTGQGAQWPQMGRELLQSNKAFRSIIRTLDEHLRGIAEYSIETELKRPAKTSRLSSSELSQPICTALQIGLVDTLRAAGITPAAVVGHSSGEIAAAYAAGALTKEEAILAAHFRGQVTLKQNKRGSMAAIGLSWKETEEYLIPNVRIACDNSQKSVTISGDTDAIEQVVASIGRSIPDAMARLLKVDKAYHSHHMIEVGDDYIQMMGDRVQGKTPVVPFFSSVYGKLVASDSDAHFGPEYWRANLESPVRFREAVNAILEAEVSKNAVLLEVGPHSALAGPLRQICSLAATPVPYVSAMLRSQNCVTSLLTAIGKLHSLNVPIHLESLYPEGRCLPDLPTYPWDHQESFWYEARVSKEWRLPKFPLHNLLGIKSPESSALEPIYRNLLHLSNVPWIRDHKLGEDTVFPFAGYIALAGEAIRQISGVENAYQVRNIIVSTALVVAEGKPTEMVSTFKPQRLTNSLNSSWWEFTVSSYNGHAWIRHCAGEVAPLSDEPSSAESPKSLPRKMNAKKYYDIMEKGGLALGPCFQTLETLETSTKSEHRAVADVANGRQDDTADYHIHPTTLDATIQIMGAGAIQGSLRRTKTWLPTSIDSIKIWRCSVGMVADINATLSGNHSVVGSGRCISNGSVVVEASRITLALADGALGGGTGSDDPHAAARYEWAPDVSFVHSIDLGSGVDVGIEVSSRLDELGHLCVLASKRRLFGINISPDTHLQNYAEWLREQTHSAVAALASKHKSLDNGAIQARIDVLVTELANTSAAAAARVIQAVCSNLKLLLGGVDLKDVLLEEDWDGLQAFVRRPPPQTFIHALSHSRPNLRVLELGGGNTTAPSKEVIQALTHPNGQVLCSNYTFTSPGYISSKDTDKPFANLEVKTLDIRDDPVDQGFEGREYDLIIASNAFPSDANIQTSIGYLKKLLRADGYLLLQESRSSAPWLTLVFGLREEWSNKNQTFLGARGWQEQLAAAGLNTTLPTGSDSRTDNALTTTLLARSGSAIPLSEKTIAALCDEQLGPHAEKVWRCLEQEGFVVRKCTLNDVPPSGLDIISLLDADQAFFYGLTEDRYEALKHFLEALDGAGMLWVTKTSEVGCSDPRYAPVIGLARVARSEQLAELATVQIDSFDNDASLHKLAQLFAQYRIRQGDETLHPDFEWAICDGEVLVGRFHPFKLLDQLVDGKSSSWARLDVATPGRINSLHWVQEEPEALRPGEVEVQVHAAGLNFRDILVALGIVELPIRQFGSEAGGIITKVAPDVDPNELKVGDRVFCLKKQAYSTYLTTPTVSCVRIPDHLSFEDAGSMLIPYVTALHSLVNVAHLEKGQSVLVHSACGGVGLAAVQVSQMIGAELYVTVGNEEKIKFLMDNFKIPRHRIFDSRSASFVDGVHRETNGKGIDVILNSLSGELLHATWTCVAEFGTLVEIGKRDLIGHGKLDLQPFLANRSYSCVDIDQLEKKPQLLRKLILNTLEYYVRGHITPVRPNKIFPASQTQDAFRYMQKGQHIGRVCISIPHTPSGNDNVPKFATTKAAGTIAFKAHASYLMIGGLGGLGRAISSWMVEYGATELIYLSRSAGVMSKDATFVAELESMGCAVRLIAGDVTKPEDVERAIGSASNPLKGVVQMSMVLRDQNFKTMSFEDWNAVAGPKVQGTWALHEATVKTGAELDFFVLFSSLSGVIGQPGQASYAAGNTFLDAFAHYRNAMGLAASVIDIGAVEEVGYISEQPGMIHTMKATGFKGISEQELLDAMTLAMLRRPGPLPVLQEKTFTSSIGFVLGLGSSIPLTSPGNRAVWKRDRRMAAYHNVVSDDSGAGASAETLKSFLSEARADPAKLKTAEASQVFALEIGKKLFDMLLKPHDELITAMPLTDLGLDSLVALELRAWWKQVFAFDITVLEMLGMGSLDALGQHAADGLMKLVAENAT